MSTCIKRLLVALASVASALGTVALMATATPASAATTASSAAFFYGAAYNQEIICTEGVDHGLDTANARGWVAVSNECGTRLWIYQYGSETGWSYCISPHTYVLLPTNLQFAESAWVSRNASAC